MLKKFLKNINKYLKISVICVVLFSIITTNITTGFGGYYKFFEKKPSTVFVSYQEFMKKFEFLDLLQTYTGMDTGYGFFSPNVSSSFVIQYDLYKKGNITSEMSNADFKTREGSIRFTTINSQFMEKIDVLEKKDTLKKDSLQMQYLTVILKRLGNEQLNKKPSLDSVRATIFMHHCPFLKEYPDVAATYFKIEETLCIPKK